MILRAYGDNATIDLFENHLVITRRRSGFFVRGPANEQFVPLSSIRSVQFSRPSFTSRGRLVLTLVGSRSIKPGTASDENTVFFGKSQTPQFEDVLHSIQDSIATPSLERMAMASQRDRSDRVSHASPGVKPTPNRLQRIDGPPSEWTRTTDGSYDDVRSHGHYTYSRQGEARTAPPPPDPSLRGWWRSMPLLGKIMLIALAVILLLGMCSDGEHAAPEALETGSADLAASHASADLTGSGEMPTNEQAGAAAPPNVKIIDSCYHLDSCYEYQLLHKKTVRSTAEERLVQASLLPGEVPDARGDETDSLRVQWESEPKTFFALCSTRSPVIAFQVDDSWIAEELDFASGIPGIEQNSANIYEALCHDFFRNELAQQAASLGYQPLADGGRGQFSISSPLDLVRQ